MNNNVDGVSSSLPCGYAISLIAFPYDATFNTDYGEVRVHGEVGELIIVPCGMEYGLTWVDYRGTRITMSPEAFCTHFRLLPKAPEGLRFCSFVEHTTLSPGEFWIYDFNSQVFIDTGAFVNDEALTQLNAITIKHNYNKESYGDKWVALVNY